MTVAAAVAAVAPARREEQYGSYVDVDEGYHRRETIAAVAAVAAACHRPGPVFLLLLLPRHATAAKYHTVVPLMASASPGPPVSKTTADDKSMRIWGFRRRTRRQPLFRIFMGLALRVGGTDGVL